VPDRPDALTIHLAIIQCVFPAGYCGHELQYGIAVHRQIAKHAEASCVDNMHKVDQCSLGFGSAGIDFSVNFREIQTCARCYKLAALCMTTGGGIQQISGGQSGGKLRIVHGHFLTTHVYSVLLCAFANFLSGHLSAIGQYCSKTFPIDYLFGHFHDGIRVAPVKLYAVCIVLCDQAIFIALDSKCYGASD